MPRWPPSIASPPNRTHPRLDSKEQLGGYFFIEVPDLDAAIAWAARCPAADHGVVEVRPVWQAPT
jgi:hypothetical protein